MMTDVVKRIISNFKINRIKNQERLKQLEKEYFNLQNLPRKIKKQKKKRILKEYEILFIERDFFNNYFKNTVINGN